MRAALFPGQGIPAPEVVAALPERDPLLARANDRLGYDLRRRVEVAARRGGAPLPTLISQPAILVASLIAWHAASEDGLQVDVLVGHSLGEYSALVASGAMSFDAALGVVAVRAEAMQEAARRAPGGMAAVLKLGFERVEEIAREAGLVVANDNAPGQVVVSGPEPALARASELARAAGGRAVLLEVSGPFHSPAMEGAQAPLREALDHVEIRSPRISVIANVSARPYRAPGEIRALLVRQVAERVRFRDSLEWLWSQGVRSHVDLGPGTVVDLLAQRTFRSLEVPEVIRA